jgi:hypothetical protein
MKKIILLFFISTLAAVGKFEPTLVILQPGDITIEEGLIAEKDSLVNTFESEKAANSVPIDTLKKAIAKESENFAKNTIRSYEYYRDSEYLENISYKLSNAMLYNFLELFPDQLVYPLHHEGVRSEAGLKQLAGKLSVRYLFLPEKMNFYMDGGDKFLELSYKLYDNDSGTFVMDSAITFDSQNRGGMHSCFDGSMQCLVNNAVALISNKLFGHIYLNSPLIMKEREVFTARQEYLGKEFLNNSDLDEISMIIAGNYDDIEESNVFAGKFHDSKEKLLAFAKIPRDSNSNEVLLISAVQYIGRWFSRVEMESVHGKIPDSEDSYLNLLRPIYENSYFVDSSASVNPDFWESNYFEKVPDLTKTDAYRQTPEIFESQVEENLPYVGMYEIVAENLKNEKYKNLTKVKSEINSKNFTPFFKQLQRENPGEYAYFKEYPDGYELIFSSGMNAFICPVYYRTKSVSQKLKFFVFLPDNPGEIYLWTEPGTVEVESWQGGRHVIETMMEYTRWDYGYRTLDDTDFWENHILKKENGNFINLVPAK